MPSASLGQTPSLSTFIKSLRSNSVDSSVDLLVSLLKRRQIRNSRQCALATTHLLLQVVAAEKGYLRDANKLIDRIRDVGRRLLAAQPREMAVGNIVRRVLGVVREVAEEDPVGTESEGSSAPLSPTTGPQESKRPALIHGFSTFNPLSHSAALPQDLHLRPRTPADHSPKPDLTFDTPPTAKRPLLPSSTSYAGNAPQSSSLLSFLEHPLGRTSGGSTPNFASSPGRSMAASQELPKPSETLDLKSEVMDGIKELLDELSIVDTQIAESALDHIHSNETILTHTSSQTIQRFLATAARKRKFTVVHAEAYPNDHLATHATILNGSTAHPDEDADEKWKPLTSLGITVILIPDTAVYALMSRINKVLLAPHAVLANGSLLAAAGASTIALAARAHRVPVVVLSGVYKLSPVYPFDTEELIEHGDPGKVVGFSEQGLGMVSNPVFDWVDAENVDLYVTNLGGCAPSFLYRVVADHYDVRDVDLGVKSG